MKHKPITKEMKQALYAYEHTHESVESIASKLISNRTGKPGISRQGFFKRLLALGYKFRRSDSNY